MMMSNGPRQPPLMDLDDVQYEPELVVTVPCQRQYMDDQRMVNFYSNRRHQPGNC